MAFQHKPVTAPLEKFINIELVLGGEVLGVHKVKKHEAVNQEVPSEKTWTSQETR